MPSDEWSFDFDFDPFLQPLFKIAIACELDPKKVPTDQEISAMLLAQIVHGRVAAMDITTEQRLVFLQELLPHTTPKEINQLVKK